MQQSYETAFKDEHLLTLDSDCRRLGEGGRAFDMTPNLGPPEGPYKFGHPSYNTKKEA